MVGGETRVVPFEPEAYDDIVYGGISFSFPLWVFEEPGTYIALVIVNGELMHRTTFPVVFNSVIS